MTDNQVDTAIVGAGPYGLSLGAHLEAKGLNYRVFGQPMHTWRTSMPEGMRLKSDGFASNLSDPKDEFTLAQYCAEEGIPYADLGRPMVALETFIAYGLAFHQRYVKNYDERLITTIRRSQHGFLLELSDKTKIEALKVVIAVGITYFAYVPEELGALPSELCTHSSHHSDLAKFAGSHVAIVGAGSSALDLAALLHRVGAKVEVIARGDAVKFHSEMRVPRPLRDRVRAPTSGIGPSWRSRFYTDAAPLFHHLPAEYRVDVVRNTLGPAGCWFTRDDVVGKVPIRVGTSVFDTKEQGHGVRLRLRQSDGTTSDLMCDHVISATGYRADLGRVKIVDSDLSAEIATVERTPVLSAHFESSVPNLYLIGPIAAISFGPMMRFAYGARFAARRLTSHLDRTRNK